MTGLEIMAGDILTTLRRGENKLSIVPFGGSRGGWNIT